MHSNRGAAALVHRGRPDAVDSRGGVDREFGCSSAGDLNVTSEYNLETGQTRLLWRGKAHHSAVSPGGGCGAAGATRGRLAAFAPFGPVAHVVEDEESVVALAHWFG